MSEVIPLNGHAIGFYSLVCLFSFALYNNNIQYVDLCCDADHMKESEIFLNFFTSRAPLANA